VCVHVQTCAPYRINVTPCARGRCYHVTLPFTTTVAMLSAVSRAAAGVLRGVKPCLTPQNCQNEGAKIVLSLSVNSEYINLTNRYVFLLPYVSFYSLWLLVYGHIRTVLSYLYINKTTGYVLLDEVCGDLWKTAE